MKLISTSIGRRVAVTVALAAIASSFAGVGLASAGGNAPSITALTVTGVPSGADVTVTGSNFGTKPTDGVSPTTFANCAPGSGTRSGLDYPKDQVWVLDTSRAAPSLPLNGLQFGSTGTNVGSVGNCGGVNITSWTPTEVQFNIGSPAVGNQFENHDTVCVDIGGYLACVKATKR